MAIFIVLTTALFMLQTPSVGTDNGEESRGRTETHGPHKTDATRSQMIAHAVEMRLWASGGLEGSRIDVTARGGIVTLEGQVMTEQARARAVRLAKRTPGVEQVLDRLKVDALPAVTPLRARGDDSELARRVAETLAKHVFRGNATTRKDWIYGWEVTGDNFDFDVEVDDGDVTLDGEAPSPAVARELMRTARSVPGVRSVHSMLYIEGWGHGRFSFPFGYPDVPYYYRPY